VRWITCSCIYLRYRVNRTFPTGHFIRAKDLAAKCKICRSSLNESSRRGKVPGAHQRENGRWDYPDHPRLPEFIRTTRRRSEFVRRKQLNLTAAEFERRLRQAKADLKTATDAAKRFPSNESQALVKRCEARIMQLNAERQSDYLLTRDVADKASCSQRRVAKLGLEIPGCERLGGRFIFRKSEDLSQWIHRDVTKRKRQERQRAARQAASSLQGRQQSHQQNFGSFAAMYINKFIAEWEKQLLRKPLEDWWDQPEAEQLVAQLDPFIQDIKNICTSVMQPSAKRSLGASGR
jgi:hypothetical protein